jgi:hypothetical protein
MAQANARPDFELNPDIHKTLNIWRVVVFIAYFVAIGALVYVWIKYGIEHVQISGVVWLIGRIVSRLSLIIFNCYVPPYPRYLEILCRIQTVFEFFWALFGVACIVMALVFGDGPFWGMIYFFCFFDFGCCVMYGNYLDNKENEWHRFVGGEQKENKEIKRASTNTQTHTFYTICAICMENYKEGDMVKDLPCKHIFHPACINKWLETHQNCPTCMGNVV